MVAERGVGRKKKILECNMFKMHTNVVGWERGCILADGGFESYSRHRTSRSRQQSRTHNEGRRKKDPTAEEAKGDSGTSSQVQILLSSLLI